jgi:uncharacterized protein DUF5666
MNRWMFGPGLGLVVAVAVTVSACGNTGTSTTEPSASPEAPAGPAGASGTVAAVTAANLQVQNPRTGQLTVSFTPSTVFTKTVPATTADLVTGDCALALGAPQPAGDPAGPLTATSVLISPAATDGGCTANGFGGAGRGARAGSSGNGPGSGAAPSKNPNQPSGSGRGRGGTATGKITSMSGTGFAVQMGASTATRTIITTATTTFTKTVPTDHSALAIGECVTAVGPSDDTGTVTASSISIRQPGPNGCQGGLGGPGRDPGRTGPGTANTGSNGEVSGA